jgi:hypothetical protein
MPARTMSGTEIEPQRLGARRPESKRIGFGHGVVPLLGHPMTVQGRPFLWGNGRRSSREATGRLDSVMVAPTLCNLRRLMTLVLESFLVSRRANVADFDLLHPR